ncbi:MAG: SDR family oxidoreductase [Planctomycetales bacterium]|nr:SDR family oxidoreductase [Planctomycetales bacterium]
MKLEGASVLLTGASRGIGAAVARALGARKARLVLVARDAARLEAVAADARRAGGEARVSAGDVADPATAERAVAAAVEAFGGVDILVNNAGLLTTPRPLVETPLEDFRRVLEVNVLGVVSFLRAAVPVMVRKGRGIAVNVSSGWGRVADAGVSPYCASKFAVEAISQSVAAEVPRGIVVVAASPGVVDTDMLRTAWGDEAARHPPPEDLAPRFLRMLEALGPRHNGRSLDAGEF